MCRGGGGGYRNLPLLSGPGQRVHESCLFHRAQKVVYSVAGKKVPSVEASSWPCFLSS